MFRRVLSFILIIFIVCGLNAQKKVFHIGGAFNLNTTWILNQNNFGTLDGFNNPFARRSELDYTITLGGGAGIMAGVNLSKRHGLELGLFYDKAGQKYHGTIYQEDPTASFEIPVEVKRNVKLSYIKIPLLYKFELVPLNRSKKNTINYYFEVGPQFGMKMGVYEEVDIADPTIENNLANIPESEKFRNFDVGVAINNGIQIRLNRQIYFNTGLNIYVGLIDINGEVIRNLEYFSDNDVSYKPSHNFTIGINAGVHYIFTSRKYY